jgi:hypothetical protein
MAFHERKYADLALRLAGMLLLGLAVVVGRHLFDAPDVAAKIRPSAYLLGLVFMTSVSSGAALAVLGHHLFDQVELPSRWTIHDPEPKSSEKLGQRDPR